MHLTTQTPAAPDGVPGALGELAARGLEASSVRTIARDAGVTQAMINYYFGGKRALHETVVGSVPDGHALARHRCSARAIPADAPGWQFGIARVRENRRIERLGPDRGACAGAEP